MPAYQSLEKEIRITARWGNRARKVIPAKKPKQNNWPIFPGRLQIDAWPALAIIEKVFRPKSTLPIR